MPESVGSSPVSDRDSAPGRLQARPERIHQTAVPDPSRPPAMGRAADLRSQGVSRPQQEPVLRARRGRVLPRRARRAACRPDHRPHRPPLGRVPGRKRRDVRVHRDGGRPGDRRGSHRRREEVARRARPRADDRADGLHHQRRVRAPGGGLRPRADRPPALASVVLQGSPRGGGPDQGDGHADVGPLARGAGRRQRVPPADRGRCKAVRGGAEW